MSKRKNLNFDDVDSSRDLALILAEIQDAQDSIVLLVRGAIILDNLLVELLDRYLHFSDSAEGFDKRYKLFFTGKCELATAVGLLSTSESDILRDFNRFRNRAAHRIDVHVHEQEVVALVKQLQQYGWSPISPEKHGAPLSLTDTLRDVVVGLVGLLIQRIGNTSTATKIAVLGNKLDDSSWKKLGALGALTGVVTIIREHTVQAQREHLRGAAHFIMEAVKSDERLAGLSDEELSAELNRRLEESFPFPTEIAEATIKEIEPLAKRLGYTFSVNYKPTVKAKPSRQEGS